MKPTNKILIAGASTNPGRYSFFAADLMQQKGIDFELLGIKSGEVFGKEIHDIRKKPKLEGIQTITLYMSAGNQAPWHDYFLSLSPEKIIFNPGAENSELDSLARARGITTEYACTLVLLQTNQLP
ncbi:MAG: CoA-binding protein [Cyclobacteriaceae bacterium]|nr:CoA-binding protein [Cyclobacteriaceae bacterium]